MLADQAAGLLPSSTMLIGVVADVKCSTRVEFRRADTLLQKLAFFLPSRGEEGHRLLEEAHENRKEESMTPSPAPSGPIHVVVDLNRCQAYAQCCFFAPSVFKLHGEEALWYDPEPDGAQREHVRHAAAACPVQAIFVQWGDNSSPQKSRGTT